MRPALTLMAILWLCLARHILIMWHMFLLVAVPKMLTLFSQMYPVCALLLKRPIAFLYCYTTGICVRLQPFMPGGRVLYSVL